jgi:hypothetical protein
MFFLFFSGILFHRQQDDGEAIFLGGAFHKRSQLRRCFLQQGFGWQSPSIPDHLLKPLESAHLST